MKITITDIDGQITVRPDPPIMQCEAARIMLTEALMAVAADAGIPRAVFADDLRDYADQIEALTDAEYTQRNLQ